MPAGRGEARQQGERKGTEDMANSQAAAGPAKHRNAPPFLMIVIAFCSAASLGVSTLALMNVRLRDLGAPGGNGAAQAAQGRAEERARHELGEFLVNLDEPDPQAFVKTTIVVEYASTGKKSGEQGEGKELAPEWEVPVRDAVVSTLSQCRRADLRSEKGKEQLKKELLKRMNQSDDPSAPKFLAVYLTSFAMQ